MCSILYRLASGQQPSSGLSALVLLSLSSVQEGAEGCYEKQTCKASLLLWTQMYSLPLTKNVVAKGMHVSILTSSLD